MQDEWRDYGLLAALLGGLCTTSPLTALRLDGHAGRALRCSALSCIAGLGATLRQLALLNLQHVSHSAVAELVLSLPLLEVRESGFPGNAMAWPASSVFAPAAPLPLLPCFPCSALFKPRSSLRPHWQYASSAACCHAALRKT
jgi:hypothetical protein